MGDGSASDEGHNQACNGVYVFFAKVKLGKRTVVWYYNGRLFYNNFYGRHQDERILVMWCYQ